MSVPSPYGFAGCESVRSRDTLVARGTCLSGTANPNGTPGPANFTCSSPTYQVEQVKNQERKLSDSLLPRSAL